MARGRFISDSVAKDVRLNSLTVEAELVYLMTIPHLDRDGLIDGDPDVLWGTVCPKRRHFLDAMATYVQEWAKAGLVTMYDSDNGIVLWFHGFAKNQVGLRYDREAVSKFPPPPGFIRHSSGMAPAEPPPNDEKPKNSEDHTSADELRQNSGDGTAQCEVKDQDQVEDQEGDHVRASVPVEPPPPPPPDYLAESAPNEYIPGLRRPQWNQTKRNADTFMTDARKHGVNAKTFRLMVDAILDAAGKRAIAETSGDMGQRALNQAKDTVVGLLEMGMRSADEIDMILASWRENDYRGATAPSFGQVLEHASKMAAGKHVAAPAAPKQTKSMSNFRRLAANNGVQL